MRLVIFGLTVTSSWGNGHATLWRGLLNALTGAGHEATFFERDVPYYACHRDLQEPGRYRVDVYSRWMDAVDRAQAELERADAAIVTSYCADGRAAAELVLSSGALKVFYDLDTPVTLKRYHEQGTVEYIPAGGLRGFDLVLSYTGGRALEALRDAFGARAVSPLYGSVDPQVHQPAAPREHFRADLSYLGTYAADRQRTLEELFLKPASASPDKRFLIGGAQYPQDFPWSSNVYFVQHVAPADHAAFYCSSSLTLNVTRAAMAEMGYCPSGRLFEAAACGVPIVSDWWEGLDEFFEPGREILIAETADEVMRALAMPEHELRRIGEAGRARSLADHTAQCRAHELVRLLSERTVSATSAQAAQLIESI